MAHAMTKSFYDWCIENDHKNYLDIWDYDLNNFHPSRIGFSANKKVYFKCMRGLHKSESKNINNITSSENRKLYCIQCRSFGQWCIDNNHEDCLELWDYGLNKKDPFDIAAQCNSKFYFKCERGLHKSRLVSLNQIVRRNIPTCKECNSFGQWCVDSNRTELLDRWDYVLNEISPFDLPRGKDGKYYFKCPQGLHESENIELSCIKFNQVKCSKCNSIAQLLIDKYGDDGVIKYWDYSKNIKSPWSVNRGSAERIWIKCAETNYHESYDIIASAYTSHNHGCPYCFRQRIHINDSLGANRKDIIHLWSSKNKKSIFEVSNFSKDKVYWKCENEKHDDYRRAIGTSTMANFRCPTCVRERKESFLQENVRLYLSDELGYKLNHEYNCSLVPINPKTKHPMPFDNEVTELKLVIEVHGSQHYYKNGKGSAWLKDGISPEVQFHQRKLYDRYKKFISYINDYYYLEIPYWTNNESEDYKKLIDKKIKEILNINTLKDAS